MKQLNIYSPPKNASKFIMFMVEWKNKSSFGYSSMFEEYVSPVVSTFV